MESRGISNLEIEKIVENSSNGDLRNNFVGGFASNKMNRFIDFHGIIKEKKEAKYLFLILNTDWAGIEGTYWWGILDIYPKN